MEQASGFKEMSPLMRRQTICICETKDADQLRGNCEADQRLCFRYMDSTIPLLSISKISSLLPSSVTVQARLCQSLTDLVGHQNCWFSHAKAQMIHRLKQDSSILNIFPIQCGGITFCNMSRDARKPVFGVSDQVRHKPACTVSEAG